MIRSFRCADTATLAKGWAVPRFQAFERVARRKLRQLEIAQCLEDLRVPPGNRLSPITPSELLNKEFLGPLGISHWRAGLPHQ